ncbi:hypothetical protein [Algoriphagus persicinus]|uniref:hypothetical protein n=1 Tax=Algoriphagus persicinus TaxID=3108754 RepID=UPI002B37CF30|nr:hypothetical protein [Algoriphagus sp. E1-3-M2]MEB2783796.1 hypothetical protein [Algoriphagus sp. E1-3-M2]
MPNFFKFCLSLSLSFWSIQTFSQDLIQKDTVISIPTKTWLLGVNSQLFLDFVTRDMFGGDSLNAPRLEFLGRKQIKNSQALRFRVFASYDSYSKYSDEPIVNIPFNKENYVETGFSLGKEWQFMISEKWYGYYGLDMAFLTDRRKKIQDNYFLGQENSSLRYEKQVGVFYTVSGQPFFGVGYKVTERLIFTLESKLITSYSWGKTTFEDSIREVEDPTVFVPITSPSKYRADLMRKEWDLSFKPYTGIFLNYRF